MPQNVKGHVLPEIGPHPGHMEGRSDIAQAVPVPGEDVLPGVTAFESALPLLLEDRGEFPINGDLPLPAALGVGLVEVEHPPAEVHVLPSQREDLAPPPAVLE